METLHRRCAGLDVHQKEIVACRRLVSGQKARSELARFPTTTRGLVDLSTLALRRQSHARGDGGDRCLLEAGLAGTLP
jgi:hypothetical protein